MDNKKRVAILGSTGSIGTQALEVISAQPTSFEAVLLVAGQNVDLLISQALAYQPRKVIIGNPQHYNKLKGALAHLPIDVQAGEQAIAEAMQDDNIDMVLTALVGYAGLLPTMRAIEAGKTIALANKETLVVAGDLIMPLAKKHQVDILPVDSEHSAIFQCWVGEERNPIEKIILTASGGPFRGKKREELASVTKAQALKHPNWSMGAKITIDSASLMNKGLEVIEAKWLFGVEAEQIEVVVHPQSIIHSAIQFEDGSIKAQMGLPDMKLPIQYAMGYPQRLKNDFPRFDFWRYPQLTFEKPDLETFQNLALAFDSLQRGGNAPCILNASNEIAVERFLKDDISFLGMSDLVAHCLAKVPFVASPTYEDYVQTDAEARRIAREF